MHVHALSFRSVFAASLGIIVQTPTQLSRVHHLIRKETRDPTTSLLLQTSALHIRSTAEPVKRSAHPMKYPHNIRRGYRLP